MNGCLCFAGNTWAKSKTQTMAPIKKEPSGKPAKNIDMVRKKVKSVEKKSKAKKLNAKKSQAKKRIEVSVLNNVCELRIMF